VTVSADTLSIAVQGVMEWLTTLKPTTIKYRISERQDDGSEEA
jgi:hypothetical protein